MVEETVEKKLTDEEIVKALECCINSEGCDCENCPYNNNDDCQHRSGEDLLDLIHRLQEENTEQKAEIERLKNNKAWVVTKEVVEQIKQQAIKDTAKEILQELFDEATSNVSETVELTTFQIEQLAKRYGVEVE